MQARHCSQWCCQTGLPFLQFDILRRADLDADAAGVALVVAPEILVHLLDLLEGHFIDRGKNDPLPQRALFDGTVLAAGDTGRGLGYFGAGVSKAGVLALDRARPAPGDVIAGQDDAETGGQLQAAPGQHFPQLDQGA